MRPVRVSASEVEPAPAVRNHHHHLVFGADWREAAHQGDSGPTRAYTQASLSLSLQGSWEGKQRPASLPGLSVWPGPWRLLGSGVSGPCRRAPYDLLECPGGGGVMHFLSRGPWVPGPEGAAPSTPFPPVPGPRFQLPTC